MKSLAVFLGLLARTGGYAGALIVALSVAITVLAFVRHANSIAYTFCVITVVMLLYIIVGPRSHATPVTAFILHAGKIVMTVPYILILWMLLRAKRPDTEEANTPSERTR